MDKRKSFESFSKIDIPTLLTPDKLPSLDGLRAISIFLVLAAHLCNAYHFHGTAKSFITQVGLLGVQVFFVLSGFLITSLLLKEKINTGNISLKNFYIRRAFRILPVAFLYLGMMLALSLMFHLHIPIRCFIGAALFLANLNYFHGSWYTAHYWSLSVEEQYYLLFPFFLKKLSFKAHYVLLFLLIFIVLFKEAAFLHIQIFPASAALDTIALTVFQSDGVLTGSLISMLVFKNYISISFLKRYSIFLMPALGIFIFLFFTNVIVIQSFNSIISSLLIGLFLLCSMVGSQTIFYNFLNNKFVATVGKLSFSIYIWQQLFTSTDGKFGTIAKLPLNIVFIFVVGYLSYHFFEIKFLKIKERFKTK